MAEIVNLRQARKRKRRGAAEQEAADNRLAHGRPAAETVRTRRLADIEARRLEAHRLQREDKPD